MEYSIQELSHLAGVTTRTLRWYDKIDLLKSSRTAESGYRYYGPAEVDRLQDILFYRALGVELAQIKACLDDPYFDRLAALRSHLAMLEARHTHLESLIRSVRDTISAEERKEAMADEKKFEAFQRNAIRYGGEARALYGAEAVETAQNAVLQMTPEEYQTWTELENTILRRLEEAVTAHLSADGGEGRSLTALHRRWLASCGRPCTAAQHQGLVKLYLADERFTSYYDRNVPGCAKFLHDAVMHWTDQ